MVSSLRFLLNSPIISRADLPYGVSPRHFTSSVSKCKWIKYRITYVYRRYVERIDRSGRADIRHTSGCTWWSLYTNWLDALRSHSGTGYPHPATNPPEKLLWIGRSLQMLRCVVLTWTHARNCVPMGWQKYEGLLWENNSKSIYFNTIKLITSNFLMKIARNLFSYFAIFRVIDSIFKKACKLS